ncbi:hypothetical protein I4U23_000553 [Adineta vaga]|nr:hypothetical protein I4U23_000553 [Adineta vaga]
MTSMTRSSITGLYHPKCSRTSLGSPLPSLSLSDHQNSQMKTSTMHRILYADKSDGMNSLINSSRSYSNLDLSNTSSSSSSSSSTVDQSVLEAQLKRAISCNGVMEASIKRLRTETRNSIEDLRDKNDSLERSLHEARIKISELQHEIDKSKQAIITSNNIVTPMSLYEQQINTLQKDKLELQNNQNLHSKEVTQLEQTINDLKHRLIDTENQLKLSQIEQDKLNSINKEILHQSIDKSKQIEQLQKRILETELIISTQNQTNVINHSLVDDTKRIHDIRYENDQLKREIELLKLKCNERILHEEELRTLRNQANTSQNYRILIAKQEAEILKLREQLTNETKHDVI